jgi:hypothetical protein
VVDLEVRRLAKEARSRLEDLRGTMQRNPDEARKVMEAMLKGPITFTPIETSDGKRYRIRGAVAILGMFVTEPPANEQLSAAPLSQRSERSAAITTGRVPSGARTVSCGSWPGG